MPSGTKPNGQLEIVPASKQSWDRALRAARLGDSDVALEICEALAREEPPFPGAHEYLRARCLAEAGVELDTAIELARQVLEIDQGNVLAPHVLALALMRAERLQEAAEAIERHGLPHDEALLMQTTLTMEMQCRPWPKALPEDWPPWPPQLGPEPGSEPPAYGESPTLVTAAPAMNRAQRRQVRSIVGELDNLLGEHKPARLLREVAGALGAGLDSAEIELMAGIAAEEGGDPERARAHLSLSLAMEPNQLLGRTFLGRVYWRAGWNDLAEDLWRSLPVEGPDDFGRHYHLALAHEAAGRRAEALEAISIALRDFFIDAREFYIERALARWQRLAAQAKDHGSA